MSLRGFSFVALLVAAIPAAAKDLTGLFASGKAPYFWTEGNTPKGIELEIIAAALRRAGHTVQPRAMPNNRLRAIFGEADVDFAGGLQPSDLAGYCHTGVYMAYHNVAVTKRSRHVTLENPEALLRYRVAIRQYLYHDLALDRRGGTMPNNFTEFTSQDQQVRFFFADRADVIILDRLIFRWYAKRLDLLPENPDALEFHDLFPTPHGVRAVFKDSRLCAQFDKGLAAIVADGTYRAIWESYGIKGVAAPD
jgi:polar amino acid transport system substrate-binding protein